MRHRTLMLAAALAMTSAVAAHAQSASTSTAAETSGKMRDECESRKSDQAAANLEAATDTKQKKGETDVAMLTKERMSATTAKDAEEKNKEIVDTTKTAPDGSKVAATGPAKPVENWFGCPPEKDNGGAAKTQ